MLDCYILFVSLKVKFPLPLAFALSLILTAVVASAFCCRLRNSTCCDVCLKIRGSLSEQRW